MTNPVSTLPSAQLPLITAQIVDPATGSATTLFHRFLTGLFQRTGGVIGSDAATLAANTATALAAATAAQTTATNAQTTATTAEATATSAATTASNAQIAAASAQALANNLQSTSLAKNQNLADLGNVGTARQNLGLVYPASFVFDTFTNGLTRYLPIVTSCLMPGNFVGTKTWCGTYATADAVFTVSYIRSAVQTTIGTVTLIHAGNFNHFTVQGSVNLVAGDVLVIQCPSPADSTLANVGITFPLYLR